MSLVELSAIAKHFGGVRALAGIDLAIEAGETHVLLGENGAGKSTLIRILTGAIQADAGTIRIGGTPRVFRSPQDAQALGIAAVYQEPLIYRHLSVRENMFVGQELCGPGGVIRRAAMEELALPWFRELDLDPAWLARPMSSLSIGYQQLVLIAQALLRNARIIIFDEPTSILSASEADRLFAIIARLRAGGRAIVYITHRLAEVPRIADRVTVLTDGAISGAFPREEISAERLLTLMAGGKRHTRAPASPRPPTTDAPPVLAVSHLSLPPHFTDVSWRIPAHTVTGIYGLVGSGRSEVALAAFGFLHPASGEIWLDGKRVSPRSPDEAIRLGIGYLPEDRKLQGLFANKPLESNLTANVLARFAAAPLRLDFAALREEARRVMQRYDIKAPNPLTVIRTLSGGNQQKGLFARWASRPFRVLILDEPTRGIDVQTKAEIHDFIRNLAASGVAVAVISSDLPEILELADRVIVMREGRVVTEGLPQELDAEGILAAAVGGKAPARATA
ncbi:MAG TPA: sugar ABC transporter ATP-binding protein [Acetobacteraceae bacterium]|nr:sugar ABC transporter ATP-binding protein [Acetobacteraceae bacterium]